MNGSTHSSRAALSREVVEFVKDRCANKWDRVVESTRVNLDLGVDGDDADDFMYDYAATLGVDMHDFVFAEYFGPEHSGALWFQYLLLGRWKAVRRLRPLPVKLLVDSALARRWTSRSLE